LIILLLEDPTADTNNVTIDNTGPTIHFNKLFYNVDVLNNNFQTGTFSSDTATSLILNINTNNFTGNLPLTKSDIKTHLVNKISDNRDVVINIMDNDITINAGTINGTEVSVISALGLFFIKIEISDLVKNTTQFTILANLT